MSDSTFQPIERRTFLKLLGAAASVSAIEIAGAAPTKRIAVVVDQDSPVTTSVPVAWASSKLQKALSAKGIAAETTLPSSAISLVIIVAPLSSKLAQSFANPPQLNAPECTALIPGSISGSPAILVSGIDPIGMVYGILELADRVQYGDDPVTALHVPQAIVETTPNKVRSAQRAFCSEIDDKPWYYDHAFWTGYLDNLVTSRFNRFNFAFGFGYDFPKGVTGDYFHFPYPYLVEVPGYEKVHVDPPLEPGERQRNLEALQFIAAETARRGLHFQLGIWTHAYAWTDSPHSDHHILGLTPETHAQYCHDALLMILKACPQISGLTLRIHGESGIPEGSYPFWQKVFDAIPEAGRTIEIDMHAKGINQIMIDMGRKTGMPIKVGAKYSAEHMSLSYHQADIREQEIPRTDRMEAGLFNVSNGERRFTRYGYADLYQENSGFEVLYRLWPGTQRHLLWGDPALAAGFGRTANFCGASGIELCEPLTFKGREGSGHPGGRCAYIDQSLTPKGGDANKFAYTYRVWGRLLYNPDSTPESWRRYLRQEFGPAAGSVETSLANSSRVLPLVTSAYLPSAANHSYWPEMYSNMPLVVDSEKSPYTDTDKPFCLATCSPLDPQLFAPIGQYAKELLAGTVSPRYSPIEVAQWLDGFAHRSSAALEDARRTASGSRTNSVGFRRMNEDILILNALGGFYADLFRAGVLYAIFEQSGDSEAGTLALTHYKRARATWAAMAERAKGIYMADVSYGDIPQRHGHWIDRIPAFDTDIAAMEKQVAQKNPNAKSATAAIRTITSPVVRPSTKASHTPPATFHPGSELPISFTVNGGGSAASTGATLWYRHVNQGERWKSAPMQQREGSYHATIPSDYTSSPYPLQYYFELRSANAAWFHPAFNATVSNQPYYDVAKRS
jgi:hypothetical protein